MSAHITPYPSKLEFAKTIEVDTISITSPSTISNFSNESSPRILKRRHTIDEYISNKSSQYIINSVIKSGMEDSFFVVDLGEASRRVKLWREQLPNITPFYAIKSCPDLELIKVLVEEGIGFDCASYKEVETILNLGVDPSRIIYANPCKQPSHARFARDKKVYKTTFDNMLELQKIHDHYSNAELFLRIFPEDSASKVPFSSKFGVEVGPKTLELLKEAQRLQLNVVGISFHVGSDCLETDSYIETIKRASEVYQQALSLGIEMTALDIGGGMPGAKDDDSFLNIAKAIRENLVTYFPDDMKFIAEPGRFISASCFTLATNVIAKRTETNKDITKHMYYLNDGVFKSFSEGGYIDAITYQPKLLTPSSAPSYPFTLWGPALGAKDKINIDPSLTLPELSVGDWLYFENMGAYSVCFNMEFNGFEQSPRYYTRTFNLPSL